MIQQISNVYRGSLNVLRLKGLYPVTTNSPWSELELEHCAIFYYYVREFDSDGASKNRSKLKPGYIYLGSVSESVRASITISSIALTAALTTEDCFIHGSIMLEKFKTVQVVV